MKKYYNAFLIILLTALFICGCSTKSGSHPEQHAPTYTEPEYSWDNTGGTTLTLWAQEPEMDRIYMQRAIANYEASTGNRIIVTQFRKEDFQSAVKDAFSGNSDAPDLLLTYGGTNMDAFAPDDNLYDFTDAVWADDLTDTSINQSIYHGKIIGLPHWEASVSGTLYNKNIFDRLNIEIPGSQEEFMDVCQVLAEHGIAPLYMPFQSSSMMLYQFPLDTIVKDSAVLQSLNDGTLTYADIPEMEKIISWYKEMSDKGYFGGDYENNTWEGMSDALSSGRYAMMLCWDTWLYTDFEGDASEFGLMPAFMGVPESGTFEGPNLGLVCASRHSAKLGKAIDFVTFLADPYNYNQAFEGIYTAPVFKRQVASISTPQYAEAERLIDENYNDSTAWLRIRGFSQTDADCIKEYMASGSMTAYECLNNMDRLRAERITD